MKKIIFLFVLGFSFMSYGQRMNPINTKVTKLISDGWHQFELNGTTYDVKVLKHRFVRGNIKWLDGATYSGGLSSKGIHGKGTYTWPNGIRYEGSIKNNKKHGWGTLYLNDGKKFNGKWKENRKHGKGKLFDENGNIIKEGVWEEGKLIEESK